MAEGLDAASFEFYEGIRIIIPGAIAVGLTDAVVRTAHPSGDGLGLTALPTVVATVVVGLLFYFVDLPAKTPYYRTDMPTGAMADFGRPKSKAHIVSLFLVFLDTEVPAGIKARALYMGSIYRIGYEAICLLALASTFVLSQHLWTATPIRVDLASVPRDALVGSAGAIWLIVLAALGDKKVNTRRKNEKRSEGKPTGTDRSDLTAIAVLVIAYIAMMGASGCVSVPRWALLCPATAAFLCWFLRYYKGYAAKRDTTGEELAKRLPASALRATLLLATCDLLLLLSYVGAPGHRGWLGKYELAAWVAADMVALALVVARGHERQLGGAYTTQRTWLQIERERLVKTYFDTDERAPE